jgi:SGNH hydrolase-like domain, acetyltransferase AlgX
MRPGASKRKKEGIPEGVLAPSPAYQGGMQGIGNGHVLGWCWNPDSPEQQTSIAIAVDGEIVAEGMADIARPDLDEQAVGAQGFLIALPTSLQSPGRRRVLALAGPEKIPLRAAPSFWHDPGTEDGWSDVVFEPDDQQSGYVPPTRVPAPPTQTDQQAAVSAGWLFDARESEPSKKLSETELDDLISALVNAARTCSNLGLSYIPAIVPAKRQAVDLGSLEERESIFTLTARLRDTNDVDLIDLLPVLRDASRHGAAFHRTDADWNDRGAFFVARALLKEAHKRVPALVAPSLASLHVLPVHDYRGTLADAPKLELVEGMLVPSEVEAEAEEGIVIDAHALSALRMPIEPHLAASGSVHLRTYACPDQLEDARVALVGDMAALALVPWIAEQTRRTTFFWTDILPFAQLELEMPRVVFHLIREGDLLTGGAALTISSASLDSMPT